MNILNKIRNISSVYRSKGLFSVTNCMNRLVINNSIDPINDKEYSAFATSQVFIYSMIICFKYKLFYDKIIGSYEQ